MRDKHLSFVPYVEVKVAPNWALGLEVCPRMSPWKCAMLTRYVPSQRSHVELITVYEICNILSASLDIAGTCPAALKVLAAHLELLRVMIVMPDLP